MDIAYRKLKYTWIWCEFRGTITIHTHKYWITNNDNDTISTSTLGIGRVSVIHLRKQPANISLNMCIHSHNTS